MFNNFVEIVVFCLLFYQLYSRFFNTYVKAILDSGLNVESESFKGVSWFVGLVNARLCLKSREKWWQGLVFVKAVQFSVNSYFWKFSYCHYNLSLLFCQAELNSLVSKIYIEFSSQCLYFSAFSHSQHSGTSAHNLK